MKIGVSLRFVGIIGLLTLCTLVFLLWSHLDSVASAQITYSPNQEQRIENTIGLEVIQHKDGRLNTQVLPTAEDQELAAAVARKTAAVTPLEIRVAVPGDANNLTIKLRLQPGVENNPEVKAVIQRVATRWAVIPRSKNANVPFEITVDVDFGPTAFGQPFQASNTIVKTQARWGGIIFVDPFFVEFNRLGLANYNYQENLYDKLPFPMSTDLGPIVGLSWPIANDISAGGEIVTFRTFRHLIAFNSNNSFDFDSNDGVDPDKLDFETLALREFGRFLGFFSDVDLRSVNPAPRDGPIGPLLTLPTLWDAYRFHPGVTTEDLTTGVRVQRALGEQVFFTGDLEAPLANARLQPGDCCIEPRESDLITYNRAAGHWKDDALTGQYLGIMDESYLPGERGGITALEVAALSYFFFGVTPDTPVFEVLSADDNSREQLLPASNTMYVNRLTPARAPANLESVRVQLPPDAVGKQLRFIIFHDPQRTGQPPTNPTLLVNQTLTVPQLPTHGMLEVMTGAPGPLPRGDLYVGVQAVNGDISFAADTTTPRGRSFLSTNNGASFQPLLVNGAAANVMLRAAINSKFNAVGNHPPELTALSTNAAPAGAPLRLTVYGSHFYPVSDDAAGLRYSTVIRVNGQSQGTEFLGASQLRAEIPAAALGTGATARITVFTQTPAGGLESAPLDIALTPNAPVPVLARLEPATVAIAEGQKLLTINGRNFLNTTVVRVNGAARPTTYRSDAKLEVTLTDADLAQAGALNLTAFNGTPGGGTSNALPLTVAGCTYALSLNGRAYQPSRVGETLDGFLLETQDHCPWTATTSAAWVRIEGPTSGVGRAPIGFTVLNNPAGGGRQATINVGGQSFRVSQPSGLTAVSSANFAPLTAVGAIASIFSNDLAVTTQAAATTPLPTTLAGTRVTVRGLNNQELDCPLFFVSPTQINLLIHPAVPTRPVGDLATYTTLASVYVNDVLVASGNIQLTNVAPSLFTANATGQGVPAGVVLRIKANGTQSFEPLAEVDQTTNRFVAKAINLGPAGERVFVILFGTGFRRRTGLEAVSVVAAGLALPVSFAGAQGDLTGLDQLNVELERSLVGRGEITLVTLIDSREANAVTIRVQ